MLTNGLTVVELVVAPLLQLYEVTPVALSTTEVPEQTNELDTETLTGKPAVLVNTILPVTTQVGTNCTLTVYVPGALTVYVGSVEPP